MPGDPLREELRAVAGRVLETLGPGGPAGSPERTAWELKMELKVSHTLLHLALGMLLERGEVVLRPEDLTYVVAPASNTVPEGGRHGGPAGLDAAPAAATQPPPREGVRG